MRKIRAVQTSEGGAAGTAQREPNERLQAT